MQAINPKHSLVLFIPIIILVFTNRAEAYIGPGAGFAVVGSFLVFFTAIISSLAGLIIWPVRMLVRRIRCRKIYARSKYKKVVIMGLDGMDYTLTEKYLAEGLLPNLASLRRKGCFLKLATTMPSMSPVAWSSFQTGVNPGKHNIYDFLVPDRQSYRPKLSSVECTRIKPKPFLGKWTLSGHTKVAFRLMRKSQPFWQILGKHGIFSQIIRVPITFPPEKFNGLLLSGMCVPDLRGSQGTFAYYTTRSRQVGEYNSGEVFPLRGNGSYFRGDLLGPDNPRGNGPSVCAFRLRKRNETEAVIQINGKRYNLQKNKFSTWITVEFHLGVGTKVQGICQFLLISLQPDIELYVTPIHIDPAKPSMPISAPAIYSVYLAKHQGAFGTLGLAEDSWALNEGFISDADYSAQCNQHDQEREVMFLDALEKVKRGVCVCVFDGLDRSQHAFWRQLDSRHPLYKKTHNTDNAIEAVYKRMDSLVGRVLAGCDDKDTLFMIVSDHGFNSFRYGVDLNRWLEENGYLVLKEGMRSARYLEGVDWTRTRAFAVGLSGIYLNRAGREAQGIVPDGPEADKLCEEIARKLAELRDVSRDESAIKQVYLARDVLQGPYTANAPELLVGYNEGYRAAWETAVGQVTETVFHENNKAWSGDHCIDHKLVPGVLFCNRPLAVQDAHIMDIAPTVLEAFGITVPAYMDGRVMQVANGQ